MASKYDEYWKGKIGIIREMCQLAANRGYSDLLDISDIESFGNREYWSGLLVVKGKRIIEAQMAHAASLANVLTRGKTAIDDKITFRIKINEDLTLRVYRMNWQARRRSGDGKVAASLSITQVAIIEEIIWPVCEYFIKNHMGEFYVDELAKWVIREFPNIRPFTGDRGMKVFSDKYPEKNLINLQYACYHLGDSNSFWIETLSSQKRVNPLIRISKMQYRIKKDWEKHIPDFIMVKGRTENSKEPSIIEKFKVPSPKRSAVSEERGDHGKSLKMPETANYLQKAKENQELGLAGEKFILKVEKEKLQSLGKADLANSIVHVSVNEGDHLGYDIRSFDHNGKEIFIEVKTTMNGIGEPFVVTANELKVSKLFPDKYRLYRVFEFSKEKCEGRFFEESGSLEDNFNLSPRIYLAQR